MWTVRKDLVAQPPVFLMIAAAAASRPNRHRRHNFPVSTFPAEAFAAAN
jgi:hypothetical protein